MQELKQDKATKNYCTDCNNSGLCWLCKGSNHFWNDSGKACTECNNGQCPCNRKTAVRVYKADITDEYGIESDIFNDTNWHHYMCDYDNHYQDNHIDFFVLVDGQWQTTTKANIINQIH